jgi:peptide/nickel transport system ATP-binding protein
MEGVIEFDGVPLFSLGFKALRCVRGGSISLVHQDSSVLMPVRRVGEQLVDVLRAHRPWSRPRCREEALSLLRQMEFEDVTRIYSAYPHQLSGGERQRIVVAQALICQPLLVIADEPTASVDCDTAAQILRLFKHRKENCRGSLLFISHDVDVLAEIADTIMVMYAGRIVEQGPAQRVLKEPKHSYTRALLECSYLGNLDRRDRIAGLRLPTVKESYSRSAGVSRASL